MLPNKEPTYETEVNLNDQDKSTERLQSLETLVQVATERAESDVEFKRAIGTLTDDLQYVLKALENDPSLWRLNRSFHAVHIPSMLAIMSMLTKIDDMESVSDEERHQINETIHRASQLASEARRRIERTAFDKAKVELDVLANYAKLPDQPFEKPSAYARAMGGLKSASGKSLSALSQRASVLPNALTSARDNVVLSIDQAYAVPKLVSNLRKSLAGAFSDNVTKPVEMRLKASGTAVKYGVGAGVGIGVVTAVLFPPLIPISAGGAVLAAMRGWRTEMEATRKLNAEEREKRIVELKAERHAALSQLANGASSFQMETDEISVTVDVETGHADGIVLTGNHSGRSWSDLTALEKAEVTSLLAQGAGSILKILEWGSENL